MHRKSIVAKTLSSVVTIGVLGCEKKTTETGPPIPPEVLVTQVVSADVPVIREWVGTLDRSENADIRARVTGYLQKRDIPDCVPLWVAVGAGGCLPADYRYSGYRWHAGDVVYRNLYGSAFVLPGGAVLLEKGDSGDREAGSARRSNEKKRALAIE
jgi:hypothetical protein